MNGSAATLAPGDNVELLWPPGQWGSNTTRALNCLLREGLRTVGDVTSMTSDSLLDIPNFGSVCLAEVERALAAADLRLGMPPAEAAAPDDAVKATLSSVEIVSQAGITYRQLDYWVRRGFLEHEPIETRPVTGSIGFSREFLPGELRVASLMGRLTAAGIPLETAAKVARSGESRSEIAPGIVIEVTG